MLDEVTSGLRKQHLPSVPSTHHACGQMHIQTSVALGGKRWFACMDTHTDTHNHFLTPELGVDDTLCCHFTCLVIVGESNSHDDSSSLCVHLVPVLTLQCS